MTGHLPRPQREGMQQTGGLPLTCLCKAVCWPPQLHQAAEIQTGCCCKCFSKMRNFTIFGSVPERIKGAQALRKVVPALQITWHPCLMEGSPEHYLISWIPPETRQAWRTTGKQVDLPPMFILVLPVCADPSSQTCSRAKAIRDRWHSLLV